MSRDVSEKERSTGKLFGQLFAAYDDASFKHSVELFARRFSQNSFDLGWFEGKHCLDAGCGGGRYSIALAHLGAASVTGIDLSEQGIDDARRRARQLNAEHVRFDVGSVAGLPYSDAQFDCVICSGVLMHTSAPQRVLNELSRVLKPGGMLYMLVYATEGLRWPLVQMLRPLAQAIGFERLDAAVAAAGLPVNRRRTYLDDLFVPYIDFYSWPSLLGQLEQRGFGSIRRWESGRLDHEETIAAYANDLEGFCSLFQAASGNAALSASDRELATAGAALSAHAHALAARLRDDVLAGRRTEADARALAIGQGHHRFVAWKLAA